MNAQRHDHRRRLGAVVDQFVPDADPHVVELVQLGQQNTPAQLRRLMRGLEEPVRVELARRRPGPRRDGAADAAPVDLISATV